MAHWILASLHGDPRDLCDPHAMRPSAHPARDGRSPYGGGSMAGGSSQFLDEQPQVSRRTLALARAISFGAGGILVALFFVAWATGASSWHIAWLAWFAVVCVIITTMAAIPRKQQREIDRQWAERFRERSLRDELTGLHNRRHFNVALEASVTRGPGRPFCLVILDLNDFKRINDTYGHASGDRALELMAHVLGEVTPENAVVARVGGDEFGVLLPDADCAAANAFVDDLTARLRVTPLGVDGTSMRLYVAAGIAEWRPGMTSEDVLREADINLYRLKAEFGRLHNRRAS